ncbi:MAG: hypothetical protein ACLGIN_04035 [Candidatus Sericytochromatia bacterium]
MKFRAYAISVLATALLVGACTANVTVPPGAGGGAGQASGSAIEAYTATRGDAEVQALGELRPYRVEETGEDWVVYYCPRAPSRTAASTARAATWWSRR